MTGESTDGDSDTKESIPDDQNDTDEETQEDPLETEDPQISEEPSVEENATAPASETPASDTEKPPAVETDSDGDTQEAPIVEKQAEQESTPTETPTPIDTPTMQTTTPAAPVPAPDAKRLTYTVGTTDTLDSIAIAHDLEKEAIRFWNRMPDDTLSPGRVIILYVAPDWESVEETQLPEAVAKVEPAPELAPAPLSTPSPTMTPPTVAGSQEEYDRYSVSQGDTLRSIAEQFKTTSSELVRINALKRPDHIWVGQRLKVPVQNP